MIKIHLSQTRACRRGNVSVTSVVFWLAIFQPFSSFILLLLIHPTIPLQYPEITQQGNPPPTIIPQRCLLAIWTMMHPMHPRSCKGHAKGTQHSTARLTRSNNALASDSHHPHELTPMPRMGQVLKRTLPLPRQLAARLLLYHTLVGRKLWI